MHSILDPNSADDQAIKNNDHLVFRLIQSNKENNLFVGIIIHTQCAGKISYSRLET